MNRLLMVLISLVLCLEAFAEPKTVESTFFQSGMPPSISAVSTDTQFPHFSGLIKQLSKAVVNISVEGGSATEEDDGAKDESSAPQKREPEHAFKSLGSGFIINSDGYIVTNNHVVDHSDRIIVRLLDNKAEYEAQVIGKDAKTDIALIKIDPPKDLPTVYLGDSEDLEVGEWVIAIGNQFQLGQTVTAGIVSAKARKLPHQSVGPYDSFIQTDASINPGSSGGPLFNTKGQVVGINSAIYSPGRPQFGGTGFNIGIGFSIPINMAKGILLQLKGGGKVTRGMLGVLIQPVDADVAAAMGLQSPSGALVADVVKDTPAVKAGFQKKDVIVKYDGTPIIDHDDLPLMVANTSIGGTVSVEVLRAGKPITLVARIEELKEASTDRPKKEKLKPNSIGLSVQTITEDDAKALGVGTLVGVVVRAIEQDSAGDRAGFIRGDVIEEFAGKAIVDVDSLEMAIKALQKNKPALVMVRRKEGSRFLTLKIR